MNADPNSGLQEAANAEARKATLEMRASVLAAERTKLQAQLQKLNDGLLGSEDQLAATAEDIETLKDEVTPFDNSWRVCLLGIKGSFAVEPGELGGIRMYSNLCEASEVLSLET